MKVSGDGRSARFGWGAWAGALVVASLGLGAWTVSAQPASLPFVGGDLDQDEILERIQSRLPRRVRPVGTSSVTFRLDLGSSEAAYKPRTRSHPRGYLSEIAAYRVARALGMDGVPPAVSRRMPRAGLSARFEGDSEDEWETIREQILWDAPGVARGAAIYWVPRMRSTELSTLAGLNEAGEWLRVDGAIPPGEERLARDLSTMLAFDYLIGNWDRFSGGNVSTDEAGARLFIRDHNVAFQAPLHGARYERVQAALERVQRFSRSFVARLAAFDEAALDAALAEDVESEMRPLLSPAQRDGLLGRRRALLSYIGARVALDGADRALPWP